MMPLFLIFFFVQTAFASDDEPFDLVKKEQQVLEMAQQDLKWASKLVDPRTGQIWFGKNIHAMRGGKLEREFTPSSVKDEYWTNPKGITFASATRRPIKAWHSGFISSFAQTAMKLEGRKRRFFLKQAKIVAQFFLNSFVTPKNHAYGSNQAFNLYGKLVSWEQLYESDQVPWESIRYKDEERKFEYIVKESKFKLFGIPWFVADRFGLIRAPWIAKAGWGDLDFIVEVFCQLYEATEETLYRQVAVEITDAFLNYSKVNDPKRDFAFLVNTRPKEIVDYHFKHTNSADHFFYSHDAEGAIYAYFRLADIFSDQKIKREKYISVGLRMADLWLEIMKTGQNKAIPSPDKVKNPEKIVSENATYPGWPVFWRYFLNEFKLTKGSPISVTPLYASWLKEGIRATRGQGLGTDLFRIDHVPQGLALAYLHSGEIEYLQAANHVAQWIWNLPNMNRGRAVLKRDPVSIAFHDSHNVHSDSPYMRASLVYSHALLAKAWSQAKHAKNKKTYIERAQKGIHSLLEDRVKINRTWVPKYSYDESVRFKLEGKNHPVFLSKRGEIWQDPAFVDAPLHNELYGYVYDYLLDSIDILKNL